MSDVTATSIIDMIEKPLSEVSAPKETNEKKDDWDKHYKAIQFDYDKLSSQNDSFVVFGETEVPENIFEETLPVFQHLLSKKKKMRTNGDTRYNKYGLSLMSLYMFKEIYLPWPGFNKDLSSFANKKRPSEYAYRVAVWYLINSRKNGTEENFYNLPNAIKSILATDIHLLYGDELNNPAGFIVIYTACGTTKFGRDFDFSSISNKVSNWIKYANKLDIKLYNLGDETSRKEFLELKNT